jgi:hypothetical protein
MSNNQYLHMGLCDEIEFDNTYQQENGGEYYGDNDLDLSDASDDNTVLD